MKQGLEGTLYLRIAKTPEMAPPYVQTEYVSVEDALKYFSRARVVAMLREAADSIEKNGWWR